MKNNKLDELPGKALHTALDNAFSVHEGRCGSLFPGCHKNKDAKIKWDYKQGFLDGYEFAKRVLLQSESK